MKFFKDNLNYINAKLIKKFFNDNYHLIILVILFYVFVSIQISALFSVSFLDGESSILSNPIIEYSKYGLWHYPFHSQSLWMAGIDEFIIHPPLHYYISSIFVNIFGIGTWQVLLTSSVAAILMTGSVAFFLFKTYNWFTSATYLTLISVFYGFYYSSLSVRPDLSFGAIFTLYLFFFGKVFVKKLSKNQLIFNSTILGILTIAVLATHWFGFFIALFTLFYLWKIYKSYNNFFLKNFLILTFSIFVMLFLWSTLYGGYETLLKSFIIVLFQGNQFIETIDISWTNSLIPYYRWKGGLFIIFGIILFLAFYVFDFLKIKIFKFLFKDIVNELQRKIDYFILICVSIYFLFYFIFVGNQDPQYGGNTYFITILIASRGYNFFYIITKNIISNYIQFSYKNSYLSFLNSYFVFSIFICLVLISSPISRQYFTFKLFNLENSNKFSNQFRNVLLEFTPSKSIGNILIGGTAYQFLYDLKYVSTMHLLSSQVLKPINNQNFLLGLKKHLNQRKEFGHNYSLISNDIIKSSLKNNNVNILLVNNDIHNYQNIFFNPEILRDDFIQIATIFKTKDLNKENLKKKYNYFHSETNDVTILYRKDKLDQISRKSLNVIKYPLGKNNLFILDNIGIITYDFNNFMSSYKYKDWNKLSKQKQSKLIFNYLNDINWFNMNEAHKIKIRKNLLYKVNWCFSKYATYSERTLEQSITCAIVTNKFGHFKDS